MGRRSKQCNPKQIPRVSTPIGPINRRRVAPGLRLLIEDEDVHLNSLPPSPTADNFFVRPDDDSDGSEGEDVMDSQIELRSTSDIHGVMIEKSSFEALVKEVGEEEMDKRGKPGEFRIEKKAIDILQEASEKEIIEMFQAANSVPKQLNREKLKLKDVRAVRRLKTILQEKTN